MTETNRFGEAHGMEQVRLWALAGLRIWLPDYLRESERQHGYPLGQVAPPASWHEADDLRKWPEQQLPTLLVQSPGLADGIAPRRTGDDGQFAARWALACTYIGRSVTEADSRSLASVWELALRLLMLQQAATFTEQDAYAGPMIDVESVEWADSGMDDLPQRGKSRTLVAATATFRIGMNDLGSDMAGPTAPSLDPLADPGPWPTVTLVDVDVEHHPEGVE